jgi:hypothetical protein
MNTQEERRTEHSVTVYSVMTRKNGMPVRIAAFTDRNQADEEQLYWLAKQDGNPYTIEEQTSTWRLDLIPEEEGA